MRPAVRRIRVDSRLALKSGLVGSFEPEEKRPLVGEGVRSCPRAGCGRSSCPVRGAGCENGSTGRASEAPPDERGGNRYVRPKATRATLRLYQLLPTRPAPAASYVEIAAAFLVELAQDSPGSCLALSRAN